MARPRSSRPRLGDPILAFLDYLDAIDRALGQRDSMAVTALLRKRIATHMPREVREELIALVHAPRASLRAPAQFLRFQHRMIELARGGERLLTAQTELRLESRPSEGALRLDDERRAALDPVRAARDGNTREANDPAAESPDPQRSAPR
ncbi:MAG: hypothetical protein ACHQWU_03445 [Gemmatimonadales bacterium]|jgi:hypothetical protein